MERKEHRVKIYIIQIILVFNVPKTNKKRKKQNQRENYEEESTHSNEDNVIVCGCDK